jgi:CheY-like chemotaxis protein
MPTRRTVLVAEDSPDDAFFLKRGFIRAGINVPLLFVTNGKNAVDYLTGKDHYGDRTTHPFPRLLLLDVKMPVMDGLEVLRWVKQSDLKRLTVTMLSSSSHARDVDLAYDLGANSFLTKPTSLDDYTRLAQLVNDYWLEKNLPPALPRAS